MTSALATLALATVAWAGPGGVWGDAWQAHPDDGAVEVNVAARRDRDAISSLFSLVKSIDFTSPDALARLERYGLQTDQVGRALRKYEKEKTDPYFHQLSGEVPGGGPSMLSSLKDRGTSAQYILSSLAHGNPAAIVESYVFALLLDSQGFGAEADYFLKKAEFLKDLSRSRRLTELARPLQYELPRVYETLGFPRVSPYQLQILPFLNDETMCEESYVIENALDSGGRRAAAGGFAQFDSNVERLADVDNIPADVGQRSGVNQIAFGELGAQTSPVRTVQVGALATTFVNHHVRQDLRQDDAWTIAPSVFASVWNGANNELRGRLDYLYTLKQEQNPHVFSRTWGPQFGWAHAWSGQYQVEALYSYKSTAYAADGAGADAQSGPEHALELKLAYPGVSFKAQPYVAYLFAHRFGAGTNFQSNSHTGQVGVSYFFGDRLIANAVTEYGIALYPNSATNRLDHVQTARVGAMYRLADFVTASLEGTYVNDTSSSPELFSYWHWTITGGVIVGGWM